LAALVGENGKEGKKNLDPKKGKTIRQNTKSLFAPLSESQLIRQYLQLKANKRLVFFGTVGVACDRDPAGKRGRGKHSKRKTICKNRKSFLLLFLHHNSSANTSA